MEPIYYTTRYQSPIGEILLAGSKKSIIGLWIERQKYFAVSLSDHFQEKNDCPVLLKAEKWLDDYFAGKKPPVSKLSLAPIGSEFRQIVWKILMEIPYGETRTYGGIAQEAARQLDDVGWKSGFQNGWTSYPKHILSHNDQKELEEEVINDTFEILFAYNSKIGASLLRAPGSAEIKMQLESTFLFNLFGIIWRPAEKPLFNLGALLDPNFVMPTDPEDMVEVSVLSALLDWPTDKVLLMIKDNTSLVPAVQRRIVQSAIDGPPHVLEIKFCFTFTDPVNGRKRTATFIVKEKEAIVFNTRDEKRLEIIFKVLRNSGIGQNEYAANFLRSF